MKHTDNNNIRKDVKHTDNNNIRKDVKHTDNNNIRKDVKHTRWPLMGVGLVAGCRLYMLGVAGADPGGPPPSPQKIAPPNSQARIQGGGQEGLAPPPGAKRALPPPPYKILDPPMGRYRLNPLQDPSEVG